MSGCRVGFVGAGSVAARHASMLAAFDDVSLISVTDTDPDRARAFAATHGMSAVPDVATLLESTVDAVYVCVPPFAHGPIEEELLGARLPLFIEKPIGLDCATPERLATLIADAGVITAVGHHWRYSPAVERARLALRDRPVRLAVGTWLDKVPPVAWWARRSNSGGQVIEQAIHVLDLARLLVGEVREVHAMADGTPPGTPDADVDGATVASLRFARGAVGTLAATCTLHWKHRAALEIYAEGLALALTEDGLALRDGSTSGSHPVDPDTAKRAADRAFVDAIRGHAPDIRTPYVEALRTHRLACAIADSAARRTPVTLEEPPDADR